MERRRGAGPAGLQVELHAVAHRRTREAGLVRRRERLEDAQHQHVARACRSASGGVADRELDLRQAVADRSAPPTSARSAGSSAEIFGGRTAHEVMSAT